MKQKKKGKICFVIYIAAFFFNFFCYEVFAKQKKKKSAANYYFNRVVGPLQRCFGCCMDVLVRPHRDGVLGLVGAAL